ncbi:MAG: hypothetical protein IKY83_03575 [Proteobacteria bacterium]|nr:hypothetical protein [Pseudomonadota bacterium]
MTENSTENSTEKSAVYLKLAKRSASQGDNVRAIVTILNALGNNPHYMETQPESTDFLAEILIPGFEEEIHRLETRYPSFGYRLTQALNAHHKEAMAAALEQSFSDYCIRQMNAGHQESSYVREFSQAAVSSSYYRPVSRDPWHSSGRASGRSAASGEIPASLDAQNAWISTAQTGCLQQQTMAYEKREFVSRNSDVCSADGLRRFDRIRTHQVSEPVACDYEDTGADRVILDFDNCIQATPAATMFEASLTRFTSYADELARFRETRPALEAVRPRPDQQDIMEAVAEVGQALSDTPSVEPYAVRQPLQFCLKPQHVLTCIFVCVLGVLGFIAYRTVEPVLENRALEGVSASYIVAAESGVGNPMDAIAAHHGTFSDPGVLDWYRQFIGVQHNLYYEEDQTAPISPDDPDFAASYSAAHAAYITQEISRGHLERAQRHYESVSPEIWREHPYFKVWSEAQFEEALKDYQTAAIHYEQLMRTPLAPFALMRLGEMALTGMSDLRQRFLVQAERLDNPPAFARCVLNILHHHQNIGAREMSPGAERLAQPYRMYCTVGEVFRQIDQKARLDEAAVDAIERAETLRVGDEFRQEAVIEAELYRQRPLVAVAHYKSFALPEGHPMRTRLLNDILLASMAAGDWSSLHALDGAISADIDYLSASRVLDGAVVNGSLARPSGHARRLLVYGAPAAVSAGHPLDDAYTAALAGRWDAALAQTRAQLIAHPEYWEPLFLQAEIRARRGEALEAARSLELAMMSGRNSAPLVVLSNVYRARAGLPLNTAAVVLPFVSFRDPVLEGARCEIFWRLGDPHAKICLGSLAGRGGKTSMAAWIMAHLDDSGQPRGTASEWEKASAGNMSFPGYFLAKARVHQREGQYQPAAQAYTRALLDDVSTSNADTVRELEQMYVSRQRRYDGTRRFEEIITRAEQERHSPAFLASLHLAAARLYQPENAHSMARKHLGRAMELIGDTPEILEGMIRYYEAKDKPDTARIYRMRLTRLNDPE